MAEYTAPLRDMKFVIKELAGLDAVASLPGCEEVTPDLVDAVLEEAGKFAAGVLCPLNWPGDRTGCKLEDGVVTTPPGFKAGLPAVRSGGLDRPRRQPGMGRPGPAAPGLGGGVGDVERGQHVLLPVPDADQRRGQRRPAPRLGRSRSSSICASWCRASGPAP